MRFFLLVITIIVGATYGYGYAIVLWIVGRIVVSVIANGAESSARYQSSDSHTYRSNYQKSYQNSYQHNNQHNNTNGDWQKTEFKGKEYYYSVLGVSSNATDVEVKKAYRKLAMECHPDRYANSSEEVRKRANKKFCEVNKAYEAVKELRQMKR
jgi:DnaJ-domain-containing protein 1